MFRRVFVGVDERPGGRDAIALAKHLVTKDGELTLEFRMMLRSLPHGSAPISRWPQPN